MYGRYDPYARVMTRESYDQEGMRAVRRRAIEKARHCRSFGLILGTLGRQGNPRILTHLQAVMDELGLTYTVVRPHSLRVASKLVAKYMGRGVYKE